MNLFIVILLIVVCFSLGFVAGLTFQCNVILSTVRRALGKEQYEKLMHFIESDEL